MQWSVRSSREERFSIAASEIRHGLTKAVRDRHCEKSEYLISNGHDPSAPTLRFADLHHQLRPAALLGATKWRELRSKGFTDMFAERRAPDTEVRSVDAYGMGDQDSTLFLSPRFPAADPRSFTDEAEEGCKCWPDTP